jgi:hypothetical protein
MDVELKKITYQGVEIDEKIAFNSKFSVVLVMYCGIIDWLLVFLSKGIIGGKSPLYQGDFCLNKDEMRG